MHHKHKMAEPIVEKIKYVNDTNSMHFTNTGPALSSEAHGIYKLKNGAFQVAQCVGIKQPSIKKALCQLCCLIVSVIVQ